MSSNQHIRMIYLTGSVWYVCEICIWTVHCCVTWGKVTAGEFVMSNCKFTITSEAGQTLSSSAGHTRLLISSQACFCFPCLLIEFPSVWRLGRCRERKRGLYVLIRNLWHLRQQSCVRVVIPHLFHTQDFKRVFRPSGCRGLYLCVCVCVCVCGDPSLVP